MMPTRDSWACALIPIRSAHSNAAVTVVLFLLAAIVTLLIGRVSDGPSFGDARATRASRRGPPE